MSYDLYLHLKPALPPGQVVNYFASRRHYKIEDGKVIYENRDTGVYFFLRFHSGRDFLLRRTVQTIHFEINYFRPAFFALEAEKELSAMIARFQPRIEDQQMEGMNEGEGPYSAEGFFSGWNFGNAFSTRNAVAAEPAREFIALPAEQLRTAWAWNYRRAQRQSATGDYFVPIIQFFRIEGHLRQVVTWGEGMPILLPRVDYVRVGRHVDGKKRVGLARWSEVIEIAQRAGVDVTRTPLQLIYSKTPTAIADWVANIPLIENAMIEYVEPYEILDEEVIATARESVARDASDPTLTPGTMSDPRGIAEH